MDDRFVPIPSEQRRLARLRRQRDSAKRRQMPDGERLTCKPALADLPDSFELLSRMLPEVRRALEGQELKPQQALRLVQKLEQAQAQANRELREALEREREWRRAFVVQYDRYYRAEPGARDLAACEWVDGGERDDAWARAGQQAWEPEPEPERPPDWHPML